MFKSPPWLADLIGIPYVAGGRTRAGADCVGLFQIVWRECLERPDFPDYDGPLYIDDGDVKSIGEAADAFAARFREITLLEARLGDGLLFRLRGHPIHLAMVIDPEARIMLHTQEGADACLERYDSAAWVRRILGVYRFDPA